MVAHTTFLQTVQIFFFSNFWLNWAFIVACRFSLLVARWLLFLQSMGSRLWGLCSCNAGVSLGMAYRFSSCPKACGILVLRLGTKHMSPALESRLSTTGPPGKSHFFLLNHFWPLCDLLKCHTSTFYRKIRGTPIIQEQRKVKGRSEDQSEDFR